MNEDVAVAFANNLEQALLQAQLCEVLLVSAALPDDGAYEIVRTVARTAPRVRVLIKDLAASRQLAMRYMEAGAAGWLL